jgi:hypothetical protein
MTGSNLSPLSLLSLAIKNQHVIYAERYISGELMSLPSTPDWMP